MTTYFISRHPGALAWAQQQQLEFDQHIEHLDLSKIEAEDVVIGSLPVNLAAQVCAQGGHYIHLSLRLPPDLRGKELSANQLQQCNARLQEYRIMPIDSVLSEL